MVENSLSQVHHRLYEPPKAVDLSAYSVNGQSGILAACVNGEHADQTCNVGVVASMQCHTGGAASSSCKPGSTAITP
jgi:hypothetical protein